MANNYGSVTAASATPVATAFPLQNYNFGVKEARPEKDPSVHQRLQRMERMYNEEGMRRSGTFHFFPSLFFSPSTSRSSTFT